MDTAKCTGNHGLNLKKKPFSIKNLQTPQKKYFTFSNLPNSSSTTQETGPMGKYMGVAASMSDKLLKGKIQAI